MLEGTGKSGLSQDEMVYTVSELSSSIRRGIDRIFPGVLSIEGELSNVKLSQPAGHCYFTLKDAAASLRGVMFRGAARSLTFVPVDGLKVLVRGRVSYYEPRGEIQMVVENMGPAGLGLFHLEFRRVREILDREGLLRPERKRPIPLIPRRVVLITSPQGAAIWDFLRICDQQNRLIPIVVVPARMQGAEAAGDLVRALSIAGSQKDIDVVVITRGGGSAEDLWVFNREDVARAILASPVPVVTAIGHEVDLTVADLVSDLRVATPTEAAKRVFFEDRALLEEFSRSRVRLEELLSRRIEREIPRILSFRASVGMFSRRLSRLYLEAVRSQDQLVTRSKETLLERRLLLGRKTSAIVHPYRRLSLLGMKLSDQRALLRRKMTERVIAMRQSLYPIRHTLSRGHMIDLPGRRQRLWRGRQELSTTFRKFLFTLGEKKTMVTLRLRESDPGRPLVKGYFLLTRDTNRHLVSLDNRPAAGETIHARTRGLTMSLTVVEVVEADSSTLDAPEKGEQ